MVVGKLRHVNIHDTPLIEVTENPNEPLERFVKRGFDVSASAVSLIVWSPVLLFVAVVIKLSSRGPVFYRQERVGKGGRSFELIKFRTMIRDAEKDTGATFSSPDDPRVTSIGRLLRRSSLDELPQLLNVLKGDMSFVGPRPERPEFVRDFLKEVAGYGERHKVKPGITGLAQVRAYYHTRAENKLKYDLAYIYNYSFSMDLLILLETLKVILSRKDRVRTVVEEPDPAKQGSRL
jgi:exopolysaccharide biosynthesis polyprenyl glycosylphosphotransferase